MTDFSAGEAGTAGLRLIVKQPLAVLAWSLIYLVLSGLPIGLYFWFVATQLGPMMQHMVQAAATAAPGQTPADPDSMRRIGELEMIYPLMLVGMAAARGLVQSAICRAVLQPAEKAWFYIRLSKRELWVALVGFVFAMLIGMAELAGALVIAIPAIIIGAVAHAAIGVAGWVLAGILGVVALICFLAWLALRFSLCVPMSFADSEFRLGESWTLTKGRVGKLLLTGLIAWVVAWLFETVVMCFAMIVVVVAAFGGHWDPSSLSSVAGQDPTAVFSAMAPVMIGMMVFLSLLMGPISAIILAPFAAVYKAIRPAPVASVI